MSVRIGPKITGDVGAWSEEKLRLLRCYLGDESGRHGFLVATRSAGARYYLDLFSGPGLNRVRGTGEIIDGSPLIAVKGGPPHFTHLYWVDADPTNAASLAAHRAEYPSRRISVLCGDANEVVGTILHELPRHYPVFAFLDPRAAELRWSTIKRLARHKPLGQNKIELFILFAFNMALVRFLPHDPAKMQFEAQLDGVMPDPSRWREIYERRVQGLAKPAVVRRLILDEYVRGLKELGYAYVPKPRLITTPGRRPLYFLVFASDHPAGLKIMDWCLRNEPDNLPQKSLFPYDQQY